MKVSLCLHAIVCGVVATATMDGLNYLVSLSGWINKMDPSITGRLADGWASGRFVYESFAHVPEVDHALAKGILAHYLIGIICAFAYLMLADALKLRKSLAVSIAYGLATTVFAVFLLFPSVGLGLFAFKSQMWPLLVRSSLVNHVFYGLGLFLGTRLWSLMSDRRSPQYPRPA